MPLGWLADKTERHRLLLLLGCLVFLGSTALPFVVGVPLLIWPLLFLLGAVAGGVYTLPMTIVGQRFRSADLVAANAAIGVIWGVGNLVGPLVAGVLMRNFGANGLPIAFACATALFIGVFALYQQRGSAPAP
jgi:MFS family permease